MRHEHLPMGTECDPLSVYDLLAAVNSARQHQGKRWYRLRGDTTHLYEVWPGGRNIAWPVEVLKRRWERQQCLPADHKCEHVWDRDDPAWVQCFKCGQVREDRIKAQHTSPTQRPKEGEKP